MKNETYYKDYIATIPNFPKEGIMFRDITPTVESAEAFKNVINDFAEIVKQYNFNKIICADARGFIFGSALGYKLGKGLILARKPGKLPAPGLSFSYDLEYGSNTLVIPQAVAALFYIELPDLNGRKNMKKVDDIPIHSLVCFEGD